jgi:hypothetical protein
MNHFAVFKTSSIIQAGSAIDPDASRRNQLLGFVPRQACDPLLQGPNDRRSSLAIGYMKDLGFRHGQ